MSNQSTIGILLGAFLVVVAWFFLTLNRPAFDDFNTALGTASAVLGYALAAIGAVSGGSVLTRAGATWADAAPSGITVLGGAILVLAGSLVG